MPLGSLSVLFKHWLNFDHVSSMPLNRRWPTYVEISWPMSQLASCALVHPTTCVPHIMHWIKRCTQTSDGDSQQSVG